VRDLQDVSASVSSVESEGTVITDIRLHDERESLNAQKLTPHHLDHVCIVTGQFICGINPLCGWMI